MSRRQSLSCLGGLPQNVPALALSCTRLCHFFWDQGQEVLKSLQGMCVVLDDEAHQKAGLFVQLGVITCQTGPKFTARLAAFSAFSSQGLGDELFYQLFGFLLVIVLFREMAPPTPLDPPPPCEDLWWPFLTVKFEGNIASQPKRKIASSCHVLFICLLVLSF